MICPACKNKGSKVIDSRFTLDGTIRRRRKCKECRYRFSTREMIENSRLPITERRKFLQMRQLQELLEKAEAKVKELLGENEDVANLHDQPNQGTLFEETKEN